MATFKRCKSPHFCGANLENQKTSSQGASHRAQNRCQSPTRHFLACPTSRAGILGFGNPECHRFAVGCIWQCTTKWQFIQAAWDWIGDNGFLSCTSINRFLDNTLSACSFMDERACSKAATALEPWNAQRVWRPGTKDTSERRTACPPPAVA